MPLIGIVAKKREIQAIKKEISEMNIEIIQITKESIKNIKNIKFDEIIFLQNINFEEDEYKYMNEIVSKAKYLIINGDIEIDALKKIEKPIKLITFGFNSKATITISSVNDEKIIVCIQRDIEKVDGKILECQEKQVVTQENKKIYNNLVVFIIKTLHNL